MLFFEVTEELQYKLQTQPLTVNDNFADQRYNENNDNTIDSLNQTYSIALDK